MSLDLETLGPVERDRLTVLLVQGGHLSHPLRLLAHVETDHSSEALQASLQDHLPSHMVPDLVSTAPSLPRLPNGKLDRAALSHVQTPALKDAAPLPQEQSGEALETLRGIWADVLGIDQIFDEDNFVEMGGDSLLSISVVSRARKAGIELLPSDLFDFPSLAELARRVRVGNAEDLLEVSAGPLNLTSGSQDAGAEQIFMLNANRLMLELLNDQFETRRELHLMTLHWDSGQLSGHETIETISEEFMQRIREMQPEGPYRIGGFSIGAVAAHEIASRLIEDGHEVRELIMIDPPENPDLFASTYNENHVFSGSSSETLSLRQRLLDRATLLLLKLFRSLDRPLPDRLKSNVAAAAYFKAARRYHVAPPAVAPLIIRRTCRVATTLWAKQGKHNGLFEVQCSHQSFHQDKTVMREWTGLIARELDQRAS